MQHVSKRLAQLDVSGVDMHVPRGLRFSHLTALTSVRMCQTSVPYIAIGTLPALKALHLSECWPAHMTEEEFDTQKATLFALYPPTLHELTLGPNVVGMDDVVVAQLTQLATLHIVGDYTKRITAASLHKLPNARNIFRYDGGACQTPSPA